MKPQTNTQATPEAAPELPLAPWHVHSELVETTDKNIITREPPKKRVSRLYHQTTLMMTLEGVTSQESLEALAQDFNRRRVKLVLHQKAMADFGDAARLKRMEAKAHSTCGPEFIERKILLTEA